MSENVWVWVGHLWSSRVRLALNEYGDRITDIGIFGWEINSAGDLQENFDPTLLDEYRAKWPHIRWWLTIMNHGWAPIFDSLRNNQTAQNNLLNNLDQLLDDYPYAYGIDIDLERGGAYHNAEASEALFRNIRDVCHAKGRKVNADLPAMIGLNRSVGDENWCRYEQLGKILDHICIMSYGMAWTGSAPGPVSPRDWLEGTYTYATSVCSSSKISMGLPAYGFAWRIHDKPPFDNIPGGYRATVATYYGAQLYLNGTWVHDPAPQHHIPWLAFRDPYEHTPYALLHVYDWAEATGYDTATKVAASTYNRRDYLTRYGKPVGEPLWSIANQTEPAAQATYTLSPRKFRDRNGDWVGPKNGFTLTLELLQRPPESALIWDDDFRTAEIVASDFYARSGAWSQWPAENWDRQYSQARGSGTLDLAHNFNQSSLHVQARLQFPYSGIAGVHIGGIRAEITTAGRLRITRGGYTLASTTVTPPPVGRPAGQGRVVIGLRIRGSRARLYYGHTEQHVPLRLTAQIPTSALDGSVGLWAANTTWFDHLRVGDGWWYQPREAVQVEYLGQQQTLGRISRTGVTWDEGRNIFRPNSDIEEHETRTEEISPDWDFAHTPIDIEVGQTQQVAIHPLDVGCWMGRIFLVDAQGASILWYSDVESTAYWADRANHEYQLDGVCLWALGQEDLRLWERFKAGELPQETKIN